MKWLEIDNLESYTRLKIKEFIIPYLTAIILLFFVELYYL